MPRFPLILLILSLLCSTLTHAQSAPWFGVDLPPAVDPEVNPVAIGGRGPAPAVVPAGEAGFTELTGARLADDLEQIVAFSRRSRLERELGGDQLWGRVSGFESGAATVRWAAEGFRNAGIEDVRVQSFSQDPDAGLWLPVNWDVTLLGNDLFGPGSGDVRLDSSMALAPSALPGGELTAQVIYVGKATPAELMHMDVAGKIAIQHVTPQAHLVFERGTAVPAARELFARGALAVVSLIDQPGNERVRDFSNCGGPCFNLGGRDSRFLVQVMNAAPEAGTFDALRLRLRLQSQVHTNLQAINSVAVIPGRSSADTIVLNAHVDAWFDGAGDNGDGLAVLMAMARHFAQPEHRLERTLVLVASAGHHTTGLNGPANAVRLNPELFERALLVFNIEHVAQRNIAPARFLFADGYREFTADAGEAPIVVGIDNGSPFLQQVFTEGVMRYGTNFMSSDSTMASGEGGGYRRNMDAPIITTMQAPPLYHTSGETVDVISIPGLERMARFMAYFVNRIDGAEPDQINP